MTNILYYHWGHLSDKEVIKNGEVLNLISSPEGDSSWLWSILYELNQKNFGIYGVVDRDKKLVDKWGIDVFKAFSSFKRWQSYNKVNFIGLENALNNNFPEVDLIMIYYRMKTKNNQLLKDNEEYSPDLEIQNNILNFYKNKKVKLRILDFDLSMTEEDEKKITDLGYKDVKILDQSLFPNKKLIERETCYIPFLFEDMLQFENPIPNRKNLLSYVGNPYNRWPDFENKLFKLAKNNPGRIYIYGNWLKDEYKEIREKNSNVIFNGRIGFNQMREVIGQSCAVPLLATELYKKQGHMTMRILETLLFGSLPIGFSDFNGIKKFLPKELIVNMEDPDSLENVVDHLAKMTWNKRNKLRHYLINKLAKKHDAKVFVKQLLK